MLRQQTCLNTDHACSVKGLFWARNHLTGRCCARSIRYEYWPSLVHAAGGLAVFLTGISCGVLHYYGARPCRV